MCAVHEVRVLVVEDDSNVAFVVATALRIAGYSVQEAKGAREALALVERGPQPDGMVVDVMLPDLDGFELCRRLRQARIDVPIVFLTARDAVEDRVRGLTIGGDDYLVKPFSVEELVARVEAVLRRAGISTERGQLTFAQLSLDDDAHVVTMADEEVSLSPTEFKLLRYLLRHAGKVVTKEQILDHVWDYDFTGESTVVETFVSSLRKKLEVNGPRLIQTVWGIGYRLEAR